MLREQLDDETSTLSGVTLDSLRRSRRLRSLVLDYDSLHFVSQKNPKSSFEKEKTQHDRKQAQRLNPLNEIYDKEVKGTVDHNMAMYNDYINNDEGLPVLKHEDDPAEVNTQKLIREIRQEIAQIKNEDPAMAEVMTERILSGDTIIDKELAMPEIPVEEVKFYPGSVLGPLPEDDPVSYSKWFYENQPPSTLNEHGHVDIDAIGAKPRIIKHVAQKKHKNELFAPIDYYFGFGQEEVYPLQKYGGNPEFEITNRESYTTANPRDLPLMTFHSNLEMEELAPINNEHTIDYQKLHPELEDWAIFRSLPNLLFWDRKLLDIYKLCNTSLHRTPKFLEMINPPTLLTYYKTMPEWCRKSTIVTNTFYAMEYHQTKTSIRDKELALNLAASMLRPIGRRLMNCLKEHCAAKKVQLNVELGKRMMNECKFHFLEITELGETSEDEERDSKEQQLKRLAEAQKKKARAREEAGISESEDEFAAIAELMDDEEAADRRRQAERFKIIYQEQSISEFQVEPEVENVQTDFYRPEYATIDETEGCAVEAAFVQPVDYWDNDDGFWDDYLADRHTRMEQSGLIFNRKFFKH